jgi:hypothetical protein
MFCVLRCVCDLGHAGLRETRGKHVIRNLRGWMVCFWSKGEELGKNLVLRGAMIRAKGVCDEDSLRSLTSVLLVTFGADVEFGNAALR